VSGWWLLYVSVDDEFVGRTIARVLVLGATGLVSSAKYISI